MKQNNNKPSEQHPLFPSGPWNGFYTYTQGSTADRHSMPSTLNFTNGIITGGGGDDVGPFSWNGSYDPISLSCQMVKKYAGHMVHYQGRVDENGIWGAWLLSGWSGGFHLWPTKAEKEEEEEALMEELLKELESVELL